MTRKRAAARPGDGQRRSVDRDGVVQVDLRQGARERWTWLVGLVAVGVLAGLSLGLWRWLAPARAAGGDPGAAGEERRADAPAKGRSRPVKGARARAPAPPFSTSAAPSPTLG